MPSGTVTFLLTDVEGSTKAWEADPAGMESALRGHDGIVRDAVAAARGVVVKDRGEGDSFFCVFASASDAVTAAVDLQLRLRSQDLKVRMAIHTGDCVLRDGDYYGRAVNRCARLRSVAHGGQVLISAATRQLVQESLPAQVHLSDLGEHDLKDLERPERVFQLSHPDLRAEFPQLTSLSAYRHNLPVEPSTFVGSEAEIAAVGQLLTKARLVTLNGPGGSGKSRLAKEVGARVLDRFPDGVWLVELAPSLSAELVPQAVAEVFHLSERPGHPIIDVLLEHLARKRALVILDNCEQVASACGALAVAVLRRCSDVQVLATSQHQLNAQGEHVHEIARLELPRLKPPPPLEKLAQYDSVRLFIERARERAPHFQVTNETAPAVAEICFRLDGIPMAIELAAARALTLTPKEILERLNDSLRLLTRGASQDPRRQTLRATIDWSHELLTADERALFRRLAVFAGTFDVASLEAVCSGDGRDGELVDHLSGLTEKSLVTPVTTASGLRRHRLLEVLRQYALEKLVEADEQATFQRRHALHVVERVEAFAASQAGPQQAQMLAEVGADEDNLRTALEWSRRSEPKTRLRLAAAAAGFWAIRGRLREGSAELAAALSETPTGDATWLRALVGAGRIHWRRGELDSAQSRFEAAIALSDQLDVHPEKGLALNGLGLIMRFRGDLERSRALFDQAARMARDDGDRWALGNALNNIANVDVVGGNLDGARMIYGEALAAFGAGLGDPKNIAHAHLCLGYIAHQSADPLVARSEMKRALELQRDINDLIGLAATAENVAVMIAGLDATLAGRLVAEAADLRKEIGAGEGHWPPQLKDRLAELREESEFGTSNGDVGARAAVVVAIALDAMALPLSPK